MPKLSIRKFTSAKAAQKSDIAQNLALTSQQRLQIVGQLRQLNAKWFGGGNGKGLRRIIKIIQHT
jgi:hypothetical protein